LFSGALSAILEAVLTPFALYVSVAAGSVLLLLVALHVYASWTIRDIDRRDEP
jgi:hypothetical protein